MKVSIPNDFRHTKIPHSEVQALVAETVGYYIEKWNLKEVWKHTQGEDVRIAILDTGAAVHDDSLVHEIHNFTDESDGIDGNGHGSHVTGIINAQHNIIGIQGIAPRAYIVSCKVLGTNGSGSSNWIDKALEYILQRDDIDMVNMSLGAPRITTRTKSLLQLLHEKGVAVFVAAGNWGENASNGYATPHTFSVAAVNKNDRPASFSSVSTENDASGYGVSIVSFGVGQSVWNASGTSMACPSIVGVAALLLSYAKQKNIPLPPASLFELLKKTAKDIAEVGTDDKTGAGIVQPLSALNELLPNDEEPNEPPPEPEHPPDHRPSKLGIFVFVAFSLLIIILAVTTNC